MMLTIVSLLHLQASLAISSKRRGMRRQLLSQLSSWWPLLWCLASMPSHSLKGKRWIYIGKTQSKLWLKANGRLASMTIQVWPAMLSRRTQTTRRDVKRPRSAFRKDMTNRFHQTYGMPLEDHSRKLQELQQLLHFWECSQ
jgi:hypothetical protein